jgi:FkbM family methyltransferase
MNVECPTTMLHHVQKVLAGEYEVPYRATRPVILDIGANVGSFAAWALQRWPGCHVHCYEPLPDNFALLKKNLAPVEGKSVSLYNFAVGNPELTRLHLGRNNCGEASFYDMRASDGVCRGRDQAAKRSAQGAYPENRYRGFRSGHPRTAWLIRP